MVLFQLCDPNSASDFLQKKHLFETLYFLHISLWNLAEITKYTFRWSEPCGKVYALILAFASYFKQFFIDAEGQIQ